MRRIIRRILPSPRRRVTLWSAWPLVFFVVAFGGACLYLELANVLLFSAPAAFLLLLAAPWVWWMSVAGGSGLVRGRAALALLVRLLILGVFVVLLTEPRAVRESDQLAVVYALDVSDSIGEKSSDAAISYVANTVTGKPGRDSAGLVIFARNAAVELPPRQSFPIADDLAINSRIAKDGTNLEKGLSLAAAMLPEEQAGRIVLISDGTQTEGSIAGLLDELKGRGVPVDVLPIQYDYADEVWLEKLELPRHVKAEETYEASTILNSLRPGSGRLTLEENGRKIHEEDVEYGVGKSRFALPLYLRRAGYYKYVARIDPAAGKDGWRENNVAINHLYLKGEGKVMLVTDPAGDGRVYRPLLASLRRSKRDVTLRAAYEFPTDPMSLMPYDCIIFPNVPADAFDTIQLQALKDAVRNLGIGFLMVGGADSFGPGGYHRTAVEDALPVTMDITQRKVMPKGALAIILHTCEFAQGNTWGKRIAKAAVRVLGAQDEVGCLAYSYSGPRDWIFPLTPAGEYAKLVKQINKAQIGDMPSFGPSMQAAHDALVRSDASAKHVIIISDGDPSKPTPALVKSYRAAKISISTVAIGPHGSSDLQAMQAISNATGGRYYFADDPSILPRIFVKEAKTLRRSMIVNKVFTPKVEFPSSVLKGIDALPSLRAYVLTTPKSRAEVALRGPDKDQMDPVLATWRFGVGKAAAFTSDLAMNWSPGWVAWKDYDAFVRQLITDISRVEGRNLLRLRTFAEGNRGVMIVEDYAPKQDFLEIGAQVRGPRQRQETVNLKQIGPRRYQAEFELWGRGRYQIIAAGIGAGRSEQVAGGFVVPYSPEYLRFRSTPAVLRDVADRTGGRILTGDEKAADIFPAEREPRRSSRPIFDWFLLALACLIPLDVGVRRVQIDWHVVRGWFQMGRKAESTAVLGALLRRKRAINLGSAGEERTLAPQNLNMPAAPHVPAAGPASAAKPVEAKPDDAKPDEEQTTTSRLLRRKKQWKQD
ncbi:MAG: VWA domain-containing protein, partial [Bradyrhizobium sp.]|nr:VWA domain-containing protein [Bradyrhizobium sp.]